MILGVGLQLLACILMKFTYPFPAVLMQLKRSSEHIRDHLAHQEAIGIGSGNHNQLAFAQGMTEGLTQRGLLTDRLGKPDRRYAESVQFMLYELVVRAY